MSHVSVVFEVKRQKEVLGSKAAWLVKKVNQLVLPLIYCYGADGFSSPNPIP